MSRLKILLAGKNTSLRNDYFIQYDMKHSLLSTSIRFDDMINHITIFEPNVMLIGLAGESAEELSRYNDLRRRLKEKNTHVAIFGSKTDCDNFAEKVQGLAEMEFVSPMTIAQINEGILDYILKLELKKNSSAKPATITKTVEVSNKAASVDVNKPKQVLVIDDDPLMLKIIKNILQYKYDVATAISGKVALKYLSTRKADIIILDYEMPEMSGSEVYNRLKMDKHTAKIPVVFLTGVSDKEKIVDVLSLKPQGYLLKPINNERLIAAIEELT